MTDGNHMDGKDRARHSSAAYADTDAPDSRIGTTVDKYRIIRLLGRGGMGSVYEAQHAVLGRRFAVKFMLPEYAANRDTLRRFENETKAAGQLEHPNIAAVTDLGRASDDSPYLVMVLVGLGGAWLARKLARNAASGSADMPPDSASVAGQVAELSKLPIDRPAQAAPSALSPTANAAATSNEVRTKFEVASPTSNNAPATRGRAAQLRPTESAAPSVSAHVSQPPERVPEQPSTNRAPISIDTSSPYYSCEYNSGIVPAEHDMKLSMMTRSMLFAITMVLLGGHAALAAPSNAKAEATAHFDRGVAAFNDRRFADAATEFNAAYRISPVYRLLYNIGQVNTALGNSVQAVDAYEKYLAQGGTAIPESRRTEVQAELETQRARIGTISIAVQPEGADISIDGALVGKAPLKEPLRLTQGKHAIVVLANGYSAQMREIEVAPRAQAELEMRLDAVRSNDKPATTPAATTQPAAPTTATPEPVVPAPIATSAPRDSGVAASPTDTQSRGDTGAVQRGLGYTVGAVGVALVAAGGVLAIVSANQASTAQTRMTSASDKGDAPAWDAANSDFDSAKTRNRLGLEGIGLGSALFIGGGLLLLTAPSPRSSTAWTVAPFKTAQASGIAARVAW